jgi:SAM-dependent methyltransferase
VVAPVARYYAEKLTAHGSTPRGVDWNSDASQRLRFEQLLRIVDGERDFTVLDYGCGYGALASHLIAGRMAFRYVGYDVCPPMIAAARAEVDDPRCTFTTREDEVPHVDYAVASGIFNVKLDATEPRWRAHVLETLDRVVEHSRRGFAFNMLTRYADPSLMRDRLYYADPGRYFKLCKESWSRNVSLLHDYGLYEFTVLVRLDSEPQPLVADRSRERGS